MNLFRRPAAHYGKTPQPETPYQKAAQVWDERIGSARVQAKNWRFMAFGCLTLAALMAGGLVWRSAQSIVTPYVIEVDNAGQVRAVGELVGLADQLDLGLAQVAQLVLQRGEGGHGQLRAGTQLFVVAREGYEYSDAFLQVSVEEFGPLSGE